MGIPTLNFPNADADVICCVCQGVFETPVKLPACSHIFCMQCITKWFEARNGPPTCPLCRAIVENRVTVPADAETVALVGRQMIYCRQRIGGCREVMQLSELDGHLLVRRYRHFFFSHDCNFVKFLF